MWHFYKEQDLVLLQIIKHIILLSFIFFLSISSLIYVEVKISCFSKLQNCGLTNCFYSMSSGLRVPPWSGVDSDLNIKYIIIIHS